MVDGKELNKILSVLPNPKNKEDMVYYHLFDNVEATAKELVRVSDLSIGGFRNMVKDNPRIIRLRLVNKIAIYGLGEQYREQLELFLKQAIENKERIEQNKADQEKRAKEESSTEDEKLAIFKEMLKDKNVLLVEGGNYILNIKEIRENYPYVYGLILDEPEQTIQGLEVVMFELGLGEYIRATFKNLDAMQNLKVENYRTEPLGKTICSEVKIESISGIRSLVTNARFECPSCGTIISVLQTQKKFKEPSRCSCGRRGGFKEISKDMVDAAILTVSDINPRSDIPVNKDINCFVKEDLLKQGVIEKLTPGNNIRVVGIFKEIQIEAKAGGHLTRFDWAIEVLGIEEFEVVPGIHKNTWKVKSKSSGKTIADYTGQGKKPRSVNVLGVRYARSEALKRKAKKILRDESASFRHDKDRDTLQRIKLTEESLDW